jgi:hypothetical protein
MSYTPSSTTREGAVRAREEPHYSTWRCGMSRGTYSRASWDEGGGGKETCIVGIGAVAQVAIARAIRNGD